MLRKNNTILKSGFVLGFASLASWMPIYNLWLDKKGMSGFEIGYLSAIPWVVMLIMQPFAGMLADKYGKLLLLKFLLTLSSIVFLLVPFLSVNVAMTGLSILVLSIVNTPILPLIDSIALDEVEINEKLNYSHFRFWGAPGYAMGAIITGNLLSWGSNTFFYTSSVFLVLGLIGFLNFTPGVTATGRKDISFSGMGNILSRGPLVIFFLIIVIVSTGQSAINFFLTVYLDQIGSTSRNTGIALGVQALSELPFYLVAAWMLKRMDASRPLLIAIIFTAMRLFLYSINNNPFMVIFIEILNGLTWTILWIASVEFVNKRVPSRWRTTGQSLLWASYFGAGAVIGSLLSGNLLDYMNMKMVFAINGVMITVVGIFAAAYFFSAKTEFENKEIKLKLWIK